MHIWFYNLIPLFVHLLCLPLGLWLKRGDLSMMEFILDTIITPIYLIVINYKLIAKVNILNAVGWLFFMLIIVVIGHGIHYLNWGISTGYLMNPDSETVLLSKSAIIASTIILTVGWIVACAIKRSMTSR